MIDPNLGTLLPFRWMLPGRLPKYDQIIIVNWLQMEVIDDAALKRHPTLNCLSRWRNREVYDYIRSYDWTARMFE